MEKLTDEYSSSWDVGEGKPAWEQRIAELEAALEKANKCLRRCADEWEGLSDSSLPDKIQVFHRKIAAQIGETLQQLEQALKGDK